MQSVESYVTVDRCRIRIIRSGGGATILFLHGASGHTGWLPFLEKLSDKFDVLVPEHPGFGLSEDPVWLDRLDDLAYFYLDLLKHLDLRRVHVVGTSLGGWIAAEMAMRDCSRFATLTLVCSVGLTADGRTIDDIFRMTPEENARRFYFDPKRAEARVAAIANADQKILARNRSVVTRLAYHARFHNPVLAKWLSRVDVSTLLIWGESDGLVPVEFGLAFRNHIRDARLVVIPQAAHAPYEEQPESFVQTLVDFINEARNSPDMKN